MTKKMNFDTNKNCVAVDTKKLDYEKGDLCSTCEKTIQDEVKMRFKQFLNDTKSRLIFKEPSSGVFLLLFDNSPYGVRVHTKDFASSMSISPIYQHKMTIASKTYRSYTQFANLSRVCHSDNLLVSIAKIYALSMMFEVISVNKHESKCETEKNKAQAAIDASAVFIMYKECVRSPLFDIEDETMRKLGPILKLQHHLNDYLANGSKSDIFKLFA
jgi:hypothetical protein